MGHKPGKRAAWAILGTAALMVNSAGCSAQQSVKVRPAGSTPITEYAVAPGTRFLVRLDDELSTKHWSENKRFKVHTLEPLEAGSGMYLPAGAEIRGHVSRIEPAGITGHARMWLTFDEIRIREGKLPIVADVVGVPGDHSIQTRASQEGAIEARQNRGREQAEAAAAGAAIGAVKGVKDRNGREAAAGATAGAIAALLISSGIGHELDLPKGSKLELELGRALYLVKE